MKQGLIITADYGNETPLNLEEVCVTCHISNTILYELIQFEIIEPHGQTEAEWVFDLQQLQRIQKALRLQHDFEINLAGVAVMLDLLDEVEELRAQMNLMRKHYL